jgi:hypothetical protein
VTSECDGASAIRTLEPPGLMGVNYGYRAPMTILATQAVHGAMLDGLPQMAMGWVRRLKWI